MGITNKQIIEALEIYDEETNGKLRFTQILGNLDINHIDPVIDGFYIHDNYHHTNEQVWERMQPKYEKIKKSRTENILKAFEEHCKNNPLQFVEKEKECSPIKATLEFDLTDSEASEAYARCNKSLDMASVLFELQHNMYKKLKRRIETKSEYSERDVEVLDALFDEIQEEINKRNINIDDLIS